MLPRLKLVEIINIGEELLIGRVVNTNAAWLAKRITELGGRVRRITVVGDDINEISSAIIDAVRRKPDLIITTGGLGPTFDDKTMEALARAIGKTLKLDPKALAALEEACERRGVPLDENRRKMALMPEGGEVLPNSVGLAPGVIIRYEGVTIAALPGVPSEMKSMFDENLADMISGGKFVEAELRVEGVYEADLSPILSRVTELFPEIYVKSHPQIRGGKPLIILHLYGRRITLQELNRTCESITEMISTLGGRVSRVK